MQVAHVIRGFTGQGFRIQSQISDMCMNLARARIFEKKHQKSIMHIKLYVFGLRNANMKFKNPYLCAMSICAH